MKQVTITTQVVHTIEYDETKHPSLYRHTIAEHIEGHVRLCLAHEETPFKCVELEVLQDPNPVVVDI